MPAPTDDSNLAVFCDFENVALGVREAKYPSFDIKNVLGTLRFCAVLFATTLVSCGGEVGFDAEAEPVKGSVQFSSATYAVDEAAGTTLIVVERVGGSDGAVSVAYSFAEGTAHSGGDYTALSGRLMWDAGDASTRAIPVSLVDDTTSDGQRRFLVTLHDPQGGVELGAPSVATVTISDDEWPPPVTFTRVFQNLLFQEPVFIAAAPGDSTRLYVVERKGFIRVFANDQAAASTSTFLDIDARVDSSGFEMGLLGLAFDPSFASNGYFYLHYTVAPFNSVIARFTATSRDVADPASEAVLLQYPSSDLHNAGWLGIGPEGALYATTGEGGFDPYAQELDNLQGKVLRINTNGSVPSDNPFAADDNSATRAEIWAYGLRNPWRASFDNATGDLWLGDVGGGQREEVDFIVAGGNYGWPICEGTLCTGTPVNYRPPVLDYGRDFGQVVIGGYVYRGTDVPAAEGLYFYGDMTGRISAVAHDGGVFVDQTQVGAVDSVSFGEGPNRELFVLQFDGEIYQLTPP